jgi:hypothetical protein
LEKRLLCWQVSANALESRYRFLTASKQPSGESSKLPTGEIMKYICLGYFDEKKCEAMSESDKHAFLDECFAYDDALRKSSHIIGGEALQSTRNAITLRWKNGDGVHH